MSTLKLGRWRHYKGKKYQVIGVAKHSETLEDLVVYKALYHNKVSKLWVRPKKIFLQKVKVDGKLVSRFKYLGVRTKKQEINKSRNQKQS